MVTEGFTATEKELARLPNSSPSKATVASQSKATIAKHSYENLKEKKPLCAFCEDPDEKYMILCVECQIW